MTMTRLTPEREAEIRRAAASPTPYKDIEWLQRCVDLIDEIDALRNSPEWHKRPTGTGRWGRWYLESEEWLWSGVVTVSEGDMSQNWFTSENPKVWWYGPLPSPPSSG